MKERFNDKMELLKKAYRKEKAIKYLCEIALAGCLERVQAVTTQFGDDHDVMNVCTDFGETPLILAARAGHIEVVRQLLEASATNVNAAISAAPYTGYTALHWAAYEGHTEIVKLILKDLRTNAASINWRGETVLITAIQWCQDAVPYILKKPGINVNEGDIGDHYPLHYAVKQISTLTNPDTVPTALEALLSAPGINVDIPNYKKWTPLMMAAEKGHIPSIRALLDKGADPASENCKGQTAVNLAIQAGHKEVAALLSSHIEKGQRNDMMRPVTVRQAAAFFAGSVNVDVEAHQFVHEISRQLDNK